MYHYLQIIIKGDNMKKTILASVLASSVLMAGGYKVPELSLNAVALSSANVAHSNGADAAYYNPANMAFMKDENTLEVDLTYIGLDATNFKGTVSGAPYDLDAQSETFLAPSINYVSGDFDGMRFGLSVVSPAGLTKRWNTEPAKTSAEEFSLQIIEINPTVAMKIDEQISVALGIRVLHTSGVVKSSGTAVVAPGPTYSVISRDMEGDSIDYGYNIALSYKPASDVELGLTYRSNIDLSVEGDAKLSSSLDSGTYNGGTSVSVPVPAALNIAVAYTLPSKTTVEFLYERTFWSAYETLDFSYDGALGSAILTAAFDNPIAKDWKDVSAYRLGVTQEMDELTLMAGIVYDESPIPDESYSFELPGTNSTSISFGARYQVDEKMNVGFATLYSMKESRSVSNDDLNGEFSNSNALLVTAGIEYKF